MNPKLNHLFSRRSVRAYRPGDVDDDAIRDLLEAAMAAPSAVARDPWEFIVLHERPTLVNLAQGLPNGQMLPGAAAAIVVCGDLRRAHDRQLSYLLQDCAAAIENLLLAASALGLGACWLGIHPRQQRMDYVRQLLGIPEPVLPIAAIALGRPAESPEPRTRYRDEAVHRERW